MASLLGGELVETPESYEAAANRAEGAGMYADARELRACARELKNSRTANQVIMAVAFAVALASLPYLLG